MWSTKFDPGLSNQDSSDVEKNVYILPTFTYESGDTLKSFTLFLTIKTIMKLKLEHSDKFKKKK